MVDQGEAGDLVNVTAREFGDGDGGGFGKGNWCDWDDWREGGERGGSRVGDWVRDGFDKAGDAATDLALGVVLSADKQAEVASDDVALEVFGVVPLAGFAGALEQIVDS